MRENPLNANKLITLIKLASVAFYTFKEHERNASLFYNKHYLPIAKLHRESLIPGSSTEAYCDALKEKHDGADKALNLLFDTAFEGLEQWVHCLFDILNAMDGSEDLDKLVTELYLNRQLTQLLKLFSNIINFLENITEANKDLFCTLFKGLEARFIRLNTPQSNAYLLLTNLYSLNLPLSYISRKLDLEGDETAFEHFLDFSHLYISTAIADANAQSSPQNSGSVLAKWLASFHAILSREIPTLNISERLNLNIRSKLYAFISLFPNLYAQVKLLNDASNRTRIILDDILKLILNTPKLTHALKQLKPNKTAKSNDQRDRPTSSNESISPPPRTPQAHGYTHAIHLDSTASTDIKDTVSLFGQPPMAAAVNISSKTYLTKPP